MKNNSLAKDEIKSLELWIEISKAISGLYDKMKRFEIESKQRDTRYQVLLGNLEIALDAERELEEYWLSSTTKGISAVDYIGKHGNSRQKCRLKNDHTVNKMMTDDFFNNADPTTHNYIEDSNTSMKQSVNKEDKYSTMQHIFKVISDKKYLRVLDEELDNTTDFYTRSILIREKYLTLMGNPTCERAYFNVAKDFDYWLLDDGFASSYLNVDEDSYRANKSRYFLNKIEEYISMLTSMKTYPKEVGMVTGLKIRTLLSIMSIDDVEYTYDKFQNTKNIYPASKKFISNAFYKATEDAKKGNMRLSKLPKD